MTHPEGVVRAVLFDRDGTLVDDVPYNGDPDRVSLVAGAALAVGRARAAGLAIGLVSNQSGVARGLITPAQVDAVNARVAQLVGGFDVIAWCPHEEAEGCLCRKPAPGLIVAAAAHLGLEPAQVVVVGDIGSDVEAARRAGAAAILVPTPTTRPEEVRAAGDGVAADLIGAVDRVLAMVGAAAGVATAGVAGGVGR